MSPDVITESHSRTNSALHNRKFCSFTEEITTVEWGLLVTKAIVQHDAKLIVGLALNRRVESVSLNWTSKFIARHPQFRLKYNRQYDYKMALCEDLQLGNPLVYSLVRNSIDKWGIQSEDVNNFDETGFQMGVISTTKVVTSVKRYRTRSNSVQPGNAHGLWQSRVSKRLVENFLGW